MTTSREKAQGIRDILNKNLPELDIKMGSDPSLVVQYAHTGVLPLDLLLGGGLPRGRFTEVYGDYSTLKSYFALKAIAAAQARGEVAALVDTEHSYDPEWLELLGGDPEALLLEQPDVGEDAVKAVSVFVTQGVSVVVWDSIATTQPKVVAEKEPGTDKQPARLAVFMSESLRRMNALNSTTAILMINQTRTNAGMSFGNPETTPGGKALPFYASYRLRFGKAGKIKQDIKQYDGEAMKPGKQVVGQKIKVSIEKSKLSRPFRESWFTFDLRTGMIDERGFLFNEGKTLGLFVEKGNSYKLPWRRKGVMGKQNFINSWDDEDIEKLIEAVREHPGL